METTEEVARIVQVRDDGSLDQDSDHRGGDKGVVSLDSFRPSLISSFGTYSQ